MNITELARKLKITPEKLKHELPKLGFHIGKKAIQIPDEQAEKVMKAWKKRQKKLKAIRRLRQKKSSEKKEKKTTKKESEKIEVPSNIQVYALAQKLDVPVTKLISELMKNGVSASVNEALDFEIAAIVAESLGFELKKVDKKEAGTKKSLKNQLKDILSSENKKDLKPRPPVVTVLGHVDHGKSSILDAIRKSKIVEKEKGGITQHIGAYQVKNKESLITFIDTPGHKAFQSMRSTGGEVADIVVLVIAADDKIQPQTLESIKIIQEKNIPFVVAINKIDKPEADIESIKKQLSEVNLMPEDWGGDVICVPVSAKTKKGIQELLDTINLIAEVEEKNLLANKSGEPFGIVIESHKDEGLGPVGTLVLYNGTLKKGDRIILGKSIGKVRSLISFTGKRMEKVLPSMPAQVVGLNTVPQVGSILKVFTNKDKFKKKVREIEKKDYKKSSEFQKTKQKATSMETEQTLPLILRADVRGSLQALVTSLKALSLPDVEVKIVKKGLGDITEADVELALSVKAKVLGFGVEANSAAKKLASEKNIDIKTDGVIYRLINYIQDELEELVPEKTIEVPLGVMEVIKIFKDNKNSMIVGCRTQKGKIENGALVRVWEKGKFVGSKKDLDEKDLSGLKGEGRIQELQIHKQTTDQVKAGKECGVNIVGVDIEEGDVIEVYKEKQVKKTN